MEDNKGYYKLLGVNPTATTEEIRKAFRLMAVKYHPDKGGNTEYFQQLTEAYRVLINDESRKFYDSTGDVQEISQEEKIMLMARDNLITLFNNYLNAIRSRHDINGKNILREMNTSVKKTSKEIFNKLVFLQSKLDAIELLKGRFKKKGEDATFFDQIITRQLEQLLKNIEYVKFELKIVEKMKIILSGYTYDKLFNLMKELIDVNNPPPPTYTMDMSAENNESKN